MKRFAFSLLAPLRRWVKYPLPPVAEGDKLGRHFKVVKNLYCRCIGCGNFEHCHGLCKEHRNEKRRLGYAC